MVVGELRVAPALPGLRMLVRMRFEVSTLMPRSSALLSAEPEKLTAGWMAKPRERPTSWNSDLLAAEGVGRRRSALGRDMIVISTSRPVVPVAGNMLAVR